MSERGADHGSPWAGTEWVAAKIGCTVKALRRRVRQRERDTGRREGLTTAERERIKTLRESAPSQAGRIEGLLEQWRWRMKTKT